MMNLIEKASATLSPELYVFIGSFLEELVAPIPSPLIMTTTAVLANQKGYSLLAILMLAIIGAIGKTIASTIIYIAADKGEDVVVKKYGKYFGIDHEKLEKIGTTFSKGAWDEIILFGLRAAPITPSFLVSVACGVLKVNFISYIIFSFLGTLVRNLIFIVGTLYGWDKVQHYFF